MPGININNTLFLSQMGSSLEIKYRPPLAAGPRTELEDTTQEHIG